MGGAERGMTDSLTLSPPRTSGPPATLEAQALFRMKSAAMVDDPPAPPAEPVVVLVAGANGGTIAVTPSAKLYVLAHFRPGMKVNVYDR